MAQPCPGSDRNVGPDLYCNACHVVHVKFYISFETSAAIFAFDQRPTEERERREDCERKNAMLSEHCLKRLCVQSLYKDECSTTLPNPRVGNIRVGQG